MEIQKPLQSTVHTQSYLTGTFYFQGKPTQLNIYEDRLTYFNYDAFASVQYNSDTKFDIIVEQNQCRLVFETPEVIQFASSCPRWVKDLETWGETLIKFMKRKRFHDFFKGIKRIGKGNFASVYLAEKFSNKKNYAVKAFQKAATYKANKGKQGLDNQIKILRQLDQSNIPKLQGVYESQNSLYLVQEFIQGRNLGEILEEQKFVPFLKRRKILKDLLLAVEEMASKHIIHRDIKPENIMIGNGGVAKLVDFGLATDVRENEYLFVRCGTPGYVAPEIISIRDTDDAQLVTISDMFSVGAVFYQMIFGKPLFEGESNSQVLTNNRKCHMNVPSTSVDSTAQQLILLRRMLDIFPESRISATEALKCSYFKERQVRTPLKELKNFTGRQPLVPKPRKQFQF